VSFPSCPSYPDLRVAGARRRVITRAQTHAALESVLTDVVPYDVKRAAREGNFQAVRAEVQRMRQALAIAERLLASLDSSA
jgi:hypothetical protein